MLEKLIQFAREKSQSEAEGEQGGPEIRGGPQADKPRRYDG